MISATIRNALKGQLSDATTGMNARIAALAASYGVDTFEVDFSDDSVNFLMSAVDIDSVEESSVFTYPLMTIDTIGAQDLGLIFSASFSGRIQGVIDVHHTWPDESVLSEFSAPVDLTEEAIIKCLKDPQTQNWSVFGNLLLMKGGVSSTRTKPKFAGENWRVSQRVTAIFELSE